MPPNFVGFVYHKDPSKVTYYDDTQMTDEAAFSLTEMRGRAKKMGATRALGLILTLLNGYEEIVNGALIHANRLALGWTEDYLYSGCAMAICEPAINHMNCRARRINEM